MIFFNKLCRTSKCQDIYKKKKVTHIVDIVDL